MRCPDGAVLAAWVDAELDGSTVGAVADHLVDCSGCCRTVQAHRQVKRATTGLSTLGAPEPGDALLDSLLQVPAAEQQRLRTARCASGTPGGSRVAGAAVGLGVGAGLVAVAWLAPIGTAAPESSGGGALQPAPVSVVPTGLPVTPTAQVTLARWSPEHD
ncbi:MAG: hypothetical protein H0V32_13710 [Nocardioidaceae bacterium]|jgi:anti-sigma factor RsiW|nr:hypothetical protein [Nocardioidaceae bacterium]MDQ3326132.1 hypothetical protein [Actinomycetota bacterium]